MWWLPWTGRIRAPEANGILHFKAESTFQSVQHGKIKADPHSSVLIRPAPWSRCSSWQAGRVNRFSAAGEGRGHVAVFLSAPLICLEISPVQTKGILKVEMVVFHQLQPVTGPRLRTVLLTWHWPFYIQLWVMFFLCFTVSCRAAVFNRECYD